MKVTAPGESKLLGKTRDDATGEAFDKVGKLLGLPYPGGPEIDRRARNGNPTFHAFPRTRLKGYDMSFSGIKTSVLYHLNAIDESEREAYLHRHIDDLCASFQEAVVDMLVAPVKKAMRDHDVKDLGLVGGVSANSRLREKLTTMVHSIRGRLFVPPMAYCMDNAAMIAMAGYHQLQSGRTAELSVTADPSLVLA
jgi:N6-L-threonylcarbamoyladenine synthase